MNVNQKELRHGLAVNAIRIGAAICGLFMASGLFWACSGQNPATYWTTTAHGQKKPPDVFVPANDPAKRFIGMGPGDLFKELGPPSQVIPFPPTGGKMFIYAEPGKPHYVFETNGLNRIDRAATVQ
jgi:hypothetical protein